MSEFDFLAAAASDWLVQLACLAEILVTVDHWSSSFLYSIEPHTLAVRHLCFQDGRKLVTIGHYYSSSLLLQH
jgi:hypothetical protein